MTLRQTGLKSASHWPHKCHDMTWDSKKDCVYSAVFGIVPKHLLECNIVLETVWLCCSDWFAYGKKINLVGCSVVFPRHINQINTVTPSQVPYCTTEDTFEQCQTLLSMHNPFWNLTFISVMIWCDIPKRIVLSQQSLVLLPSILVQYGTWDGVTVLFWLICLKEYDFQVM